MAGGTRAERIESEPAGGWGRGLGSDLIVARLGYLGIVLVLVLGGLGLPVPEEAPIILAAVLARTARCRRPWL